MLRYFHRAALLFPNPPGSNKHAERGTEHIPKGIIVDRVLHQAGCIFKWKEESINKTTWVGMILESFFVKDANQED